MANSRNNITMNGNDGHFLRSLNLNAVIKPVENHGKQV